MLMYVLFFATFVVGVAVGIVLSKLLEKKDGEIIPPDDEVIIPPPSPRRQG